MRSLSSAGRHTCCARACGLLRVCFVFVLYYPYRPRSLLASRICNIGVNVFRDALLAADDDDDDDIAASHSGRTSETIL
eukprot:4891499-Pleurochrysis_carterae.AAC.1